MNLIKLIKNVFYIAFKGIIKVKYLLITTIIYY